MYVEIRVRPGSESIVRDAVSNALRKLEEGGSVIDFWMSDSPQNSSHTRQSQSQVIYVTEERVSEGNRTDREDLALKVTNPSLTTYFDACDVCDDQTSLGTVEEVVIKQHTKKNVKFFCNNCIRGF